MTISKIQYTKYLEIIEEFLLDNMQDKLNIYGITDTRSINYIHLYISVILQAFKDYHYGAIEQKEDAMSYLNSPVYLKHVKYTLTDVDIFNGLLISPHDNSAHIKNMLETNSFETEDSDLNWD